MRKPPTPEQAEAQRARSRERQRRYRSRMREEAAARGEVLGRREYHYQCPVCQEPLRSPSGVTQHMVAIHGSTLIEGETPCVERDEIS